MGLIGNGLVLEQKHSCAMNVHIIHNISVLTGQENQEGKL
jgi:hypothetical protein